MAWEMSGSIRLQLSLDLLFGISASVGGFPTTDFR